MFRNSALMKNCESVFLNSNEECTDDNGYRGSISENIEENGSIISNISGDMQPIAKEFRQHYERKLREICEDNKVDCIQAKMKLQEDWIRDLTEQNDMLIKAVIELESEATQRVKILEGKLKESAACACEVMNGWRGRAETNAQQHFQTQEQLASDVRSLLKLLRKARTTAGDVSALTADTHFHHVSAQELNEALQLNEADIDEQAQGASAAKDRQIEQLQMNLGHGANTRFEESDQFRKMQENYSLLKQTMQDVRDALTAEVADKHDVIVTLRRDVQLLEEQCRRADQQTHFKDDIIKELRKDLKHFKQESTCTGDCPAKLQVVVLEKENRDLKGAIKQAQLELEQLENKTENYLDGVGENFEKHLQVMQIDVIPAVSLSEAHICADQFADNEELRNIFIGSKPSGGGGGSKSTSQKSSTFELEDVINNLTESISQMMMRNAINKSCNKRIQDLEQQLAESMKTKDLDINEERNRRNVEINNLIRTIEEQEDTLQSLQYQSKNLTECMNISALKGTIKELKEEHNQMYQVIECQKAELRICSQELLRLQDILQTDPPIEEVDPISFEKRLQDTLKTNETLMVEITILKSKLASESKSGAIYNDRISELQSMISDKNVEIERWHQTAVDFKRQVDDAAQKQAELEHNINSMQRSIVKCDIVSVMQNEQTDSCREEVDVCLGELRQLKGKINLDASIYAQKIEELQTLKTRCALQNGNVEVLKRDLNDERIRHKDEILNLKQQIRELKERGTTLELNNLNHLECIKNLESTLKDIAERERQLLSESSNRESELAQRMTKSRSDEIRLVSEVTQLEQRAAELHAEVQRLRSELEKITIVCADRQAEMASLKTEVNLLLQKQEKIKAENSKLRAHINNLQRNKRSANGDSEKLMSQLDSCLRQLEQLHGEKEFLAIQNEQLTQCMCTREAELLQAQEQLEEIKANRDEVCQESRTVVTNVRQWLHHQHVISEQVKEKVRRLEQENSDLQQTVHEMTTDSIIAVPCRMRGGSPTRSRSSNLIYPCNCNLNSRGGTQSPASVMSGASGSSADDSSVNYSSGSGNESEIKLAKQMSTPEVWLHKVENMTAELQRSNSYWKRKLYKAKSMHDEQ